MHTNNSGESKHSMKMMAACVVLAGLAMVLVASGFGPGALFIIPCMLMMGAMFWMMMNMGGRGNRRE